MSDTIDKRVVEMRFDNQQFESRTKTTLGTLAKLKEALNFSHASDGLDQLNKSVKNVNMSGLRSAIDGVQVSFSKMEMMAIRALENITDRVVNMGISLAKNLTVDQLSAGWEKYADKTTAVQTIMAATANQFTDTGEQMEYVNAQLDRLNWFTDETSYNFVDMVGNIGKFTSNGVKLEDAATAMQGIATWAAVSGQNAGTASRAMYQLSQAMGTGALKLQDWMSIETANMATYEFKEMALETATSLGILEKTADGCYKTIEDGTEITIKGFRESLKEGWLTSDVLVDVLNQYGGFTNKLYEVSEATGESATDLLNWIDRYRDAGTNTSEVIQSMANATGVSVQDLRGYMEELTDDMYSLGEKSFRAAQEAKTFQDAIDATKDAVSTGWMQTFEIIFGDYEEARVRWTALANELWDIFASGAEARNELLEDALGVPQSLVMENVTSWSAIQKAIEDAGIPLDDFIKKCLDLGGKSGQGLESIEAFKESLNEGWLTGDIVATAIDAFIGPIGYAEDAVTDASHSFEQFKQIVSDTIVPGIWGNGADRVKRYTEAGWNAEAMQNAVNKVLAGSELTMEDYQAALEGVTDEQLKSAGYTDEQISNLRALQQEYWDLGGAVDDSGASLTDLRTGSELLFDGISKGWNAIKGIFSAMKAGWDTAFPPMTSERLYEILTAFNSITTSFNEWLGNWDDSEGTPISRTVENIKDTFAGLGSILGIGWDVLKEVAMFLKDTFGDELGSAADKVLNFTGTIGRFIVNLRQWIKDNNIIGTGLASLKEWINSIATGFKTWYDSFKELPWVQERLEKLNTWFGTIGDTITKIFPKSSKAVKDLWDRVRVFFKRSGQGGFEGIITYVKSLGSALQSDLIEKWNSLRNSEFFGGFIAGLESIWTAVKTLDFSVLSDGVKSIYESIKNFLQPVFDFFSGIKEKLIGYADSVGEGFTSIGDVLSNAGTYLRKHIGSIIAAFALFVGGAAVWKFVSTIISIARALMHPVATIVDALNSFASAAKGIKNAANALAIVEVALAIAGLAFAAVEIGRADLGQLAKGVGVIGVLGLLIIGIIKAMSALNSSKKDLNPKTIKEKAGSMLQIVELAGAVYLVAKAFQTVLEASEGKSWQQIVAVIGGLTIAVVALSALGWAISKYGGTGGKGVGGAMAAIGLDVYLISKSFADILEAISAEGVTESKIGWTTGIVIGMTIALGLVAAALARISKLSDTSGEIGKIGGGIFAVALAVRILASAINAISEIDFSKWDEGQTWTLIGIIGGLAAVMIALSKMPASAGLNGLGVLGVAAAVEILAIAIRTMASLDGGDVAKGVIAIGAMLIFIGKFTKMTEAGSKLTAKSAVVFLGLSAAILILSGAIALLSLLKTEDVIVGTIAIGALILCIGEMLKLSAGAKDLNILDYIGIVAIVAVIAAALVALSLLDPAKVAVGTACLGAIMALMALLLKVGESAKAAIAPIAVVTLAVGAIGGILYLLANNTEPGRALEAAASIATVFVAMGAVFAAAGALIEFIFTGIAAITALTLAITVLGGFLMLIGSIITDGALKNMDKAIEFAYKVGEFVGAIIGGFAAGVMKGIEDIGNSLTAFSKNAKGFTDDMAEIGKNPKVINGIETLASAILKLTAADLINSISSFLGGGLDKMGKKFSDSMISFADAVRSIIGKEGFGDISKSDLTKVSLATEAAESFVNFQKNLPKTGGVVQKILGEPESLSSFALQMVAFASAVKITVGPEGFQDVTEEQLSKFDAVASAVSAFVDLQNDLPSSGGIVQKIIGEKEDLDDFGEQLKNFAGAVKKAVSEEGFKNVTEEQLSKFDDIATAVTAFATLQGKLPETGGIVQRIIGEKQDLGNFGEQLYEFGKAVKKASQEEAFGGISDDQLKVIGVVSQAASAFIALQHVLPSTGGIFQRIIGTPTDISTFGDQIKNFAASIRVAIGTEGFGDLTDADFGKFDLVADAVQKILDLQAQLPDEDGWLDEIFGGGTLDIQEFGSELVAFAEAVVEFCGKFTDNNVDTTWLNTVATNIQGLIDLGMNNSFDGFGDFNSGLVEYGRAIWQFYCDLDGIDATKIGDINTALSAIIDAAADFSTTTAASFTEFSTAFSSLSTTAIENFRLSFLDGTKSLSEAVATVLKVAVKVAESYKTDFEKTGDTYVDELLSGMNNFKASVMTLKVQMLTRSLLTTLGAEKSGFKTKGSEAVTEYLNEFQNKPDSAKTTGSSFAQSVLSGLSQNADSFRQKGVSAASSYISAISSYFSSARSAGSSLSIRALSGLSQNIESARSYGNNFSLSFIWGMQGYMTSAFNTAYNIGVSAVNGLRRGIDAHSPSKEAGKSADDFGIGFTANLLNWTVQAGEAAEEIGAEAVSKLNTAISKIPDLLAEGMDFDPVIRPRVDLTSAQESVQTLNGMFNKSIGVAADVASVTGSAVNVSRVRTVSGDSMQGVEGEKQISAQPLTIQNTFNITSNDPEEVANTVSRRIQRQVERKEATWAQLSGMRSPLVRSR